jgi:hypothetical protein
MKQCPRCLLTYDDDQLNFCLNDGELLTAFGRSPTHSGDEATRTLILDQSRATNPVGWPSSPANAPLEQWQSPNAPVPQFGQYLMPLSANKTMAGLSLGLGITSLVIGWCCSSGMVLGPAALVTGFIALSQMKKDPSQYGGRGLAIGGIVTGSIFLCLYVLILVIWGLATIGGGLFN